tara:strand:- start:1793 stop:3100 length:1308 start_codon:yes stop_codon:yes gene_type:complete
MASSYSDLKIELINTGEQSGSWGTTTNTNLGTAIEEAIVGTVDVAFSSGQVTLTLSNSNATQSARHLRLNLTGTSGGAQNLVVPAIQKNYLVNNGTADTITVKTPSGSGIGVPSGKTMWVYNNGTNVVDAVTAVSSLQSDGGVTVDNITIDGTQIDLSSGDLLIDVAGDINLDADGGDISFEDAGTEVGRINMDSSNLTIRSAVSDKDVIIQGNDGGSNITALTLDMSAAGAATFNDSVTATSVTANGGVTVDNITIDGTEIDLSSGDLTLDVAGDINLDADGGDVIIKDDGTEIGRFANSSSDFVIQSAVSDKDMIFKGNDGGSTITALTLDMSGAGAATFNNDVTAFSDERLKDNIETITNALDKVTNMRGVTFTREGRQGTGVIAQEMQKVMPEVVHDENEYMSVAYGNLVGVLIEAVKELKAEVDELKKGK